LRQRGKLVGVRHLISNEPDPRWLLQDAVLDSLSLLAAAGLVFDAIPVNAAQFESVLAVAQRLPALKIVMNHLGRPPIPEQGREPTSAARGGEDAQRGGTPTCSLRAVRRRIVRQFNWVIADHPP
jgi:predicted TIM-barrel fold metal-dependent hydrolase